MQSPADEIKRIKLQYERLKKIQQFLAGLALADDIKTVANELVEFVRALTQHDRVLLFILDEENIGLKFGAMSPVPESKEELQKLERAYISTYNSDSDAVLEQLLNNQSTIINADDHSDTLVTQVVQSAGISHYCGIPLVVQSTLVGVIILELPESGVIPPDDYELLQLITINTAVTIHNTREQEKTVKKLADKMHEMGIFQQINRELNETIALATVFNMTMDWALRFTNANAASIALYEEETDTLRTDFIYGYAITTSAFEKIRAPYTGSVAHRVVRSGKPEMMPDIRLDQNYLPIDHRVQSQMAVPVLREDRVVAVVTLESHKVNGFTDGHQEFVQNLASRAAVAIDNARLYGESERERGKLSHILSNIGDVVIVIGDDGNIMLMNQAAVSALRLYSEAEFIGRSFEDAIQYNPLVNVYRRARDTEENSTDELTLPNGRSYHTRADYHGSIGWIIVMQDVTPYKEMDKLKSELIATVSHDLKQPLSVMRGYLDLLQMKNTFTGSSTDYVKMIDRSISNMRQLIDDLLDLAKIESGIELELRQVSLQQILTESIDNNRGAAEVKSMTVVSNIPDDFLTIDGEEQRLSQIFNNLVSNAIKYTPPEGTVTLTAERRGQTIRVAIQDTGLGISPEDQAQIFERFYRVRRPETESIDGTGLGLAIVKSLVEAHNGKIRLESKLGEGTTFYVTFPVSEQISVT